MKLEIELRIKRLEAMLKFAMSQNPISLTAIKTIKRELIERKKLEELDKYKQG